MTNLGLSLALPWIVFVAVWAVLAAALSLTRPLIQRCLAPIEPRQRSALLLALAVLPPTVAALVAVLGFLPVVGGVIVDRHCHPGVGCAAHVPMLQAGTTHAIALGIALTGAGGMLLSPVLARLRRTARLANTLASVAEPSESRRFETIESRLEFAYCVGLLRPKILVSRGLLERLKPAELGVVLRHERAHAARRDNLRQWLALLSLLPLPRAQRRSILRELALAADQACDREAAAHAGGAAVIEALSAACHGITAGPARGAPDLDRAATVAARIRALREQPQRRLPAVPAFALVIVVYAAVVLAATYVAHHGVELVLGWLA